MQGKSPVGSRTESTEIAGRSPHCHSSKASTWKFPLDLLGYQPTDNPTRPHWYNWYIGAKGRRLEFNLGSCRGAHPHGRRQPAWPGLPLLFFISSSLLFFLLFMFSLVPTWFQYNSYINIHSTILNDYKIEDFFCVYFRKSLSNKLDSSSFHTVCPCYSVAN